jgi:long-chain acyl-CoA synthetase
MHFGAEHLILLGYLDSLFVESEARSVPPPREIPATLNRLFAGAMRAHDRTTALLHSDGGVWRPTPDWRLDRQVIRLALYLRERIGVAPGDRIALLAELRPEWLVADLAALGLGAVSVALDPRLGGQALGTALADAQPMLTFVSPAALAALTRLDGRAPAQSQLVLLEPPTAASELASLDAWLELGGTLDTPERAQAFRASARELDPNAPAMRHYIATPSGWSRIDLTQGEIVARLRTGPLAERGRPGDVAVVLDPAVSPAARLAVYSFLGDGYTATALAPPGARPEDLVALRPTVVVAPPALAGDIVRAAAPRPGVRRWLGRRRATGDLLGGRLRRVDAIGPIDATLASRPGARLTVRSLPSTTIGS